MLSIVSNFFRYFLFRLRYSGTVLCGSIENQSSQIHFKSYGTGPAILLLHGGLSNRLSWFSQIPFLVSAGHQLIILDTRGHGRSEFGQEELTYRLLASDAVKVLDKLEIEQTDIIGWSDGGNTALLMGRYWPQRVKRLITISANFNPTGLLPELLKETDQPSKGFMYWLKRGWTGAGRQLRELEEKVKQMWKTRPDLTLDDLSRIRTPTLVVVGENDLILVEHARILAKKLHEGTLAVISGGHATPVTQSKKVNELIAEFLKL